MVSKSMIQTFSYPATDAEIIEEATRMAKADGVSFSEFIVSLVKEEVRKKAVGAIDPLNLKSNNTYVSNTEKPLQSDLTQWIKLIPNVQEQKTLNVLKGQAMEIARRSDKRSKELYFQGIRS